MTFAEGALRFILGGTLVLLIGLAAKDGRSTLAGILAMFPVITAVSFTFIAQSGDIKHLRDTVSSGFLFLPRSDALRRRPSDRPRRLGDRRPCRLFPQAVTVVRRFARNLRTVITE
jgi:hypothetical protein